MSKTPEYSPREEVFSSLFKLVSTCAPFVTTSRKLKLWGDTQKEDRPCLFMHEIDDDVKGGDAGPPQIIVMHCNLFIYTWAKDVDVPASLLNPLIDAVFMVMRPSPMTGKNNLGLAYVDQCWISGKLFKDVGDLDGDGLAIIPVSIRMASPLVYAKKP